MVEQYKNIAEFQDATVAMTYQPIAKNATSYQSESQMEERLIAQLQAQGYDRPAIHTESELISNLRIQLQKLNDYTFSDAEWDRFFTTQLAKPNSDIIEKTKMIQESDTAIALQLDNGSYKNIRLLDKKDIHRNFLQVINQYVPDGGARENRYDVTILVNGLPLVHIELKRRGVDIKEAFNQIRRYGRESFWAGNGLFEFVQLFVISNGTYTKYYSNTTRARRVKEASSTKKSSQYNTSNSFEFTSYWADRNNKIIPDIEDFTATFFSRHTLLNVLTRYCVLTVDNTLLVMRPYQISATESIIQRINKSTNYKEYGSIKGGGYIWHTTGSGKTLTSYKTARLATEIDGIDKVLFVVDRKDLDYQTMKEYNRFEKDSVNGNKSTEALKRQLESPTARIIVTTIQKLAVFIKKYPGHDIYGKHVVIIFDECHRSQFGDMHKAIVKNFKKYHIFGFTGTPIFPQNAQSNKGVLMTTEQTFGDRLHIYTILNAIEDGNVLPFKVDYISTGKKVKDTTTQELIEAIDSEEALMAPERIANVTKYIIEHFGQKTKQDRAYEFNRLMNIATVARKGGAQEDKRHTRITGFNSIFCVQSIPAAMRYYEEFKRQQDCLTDEQKLKVGLIYSFGVNEAESDGGMPDENSESTSNLDKPSRDFLEMAILDYNVMFGTSYDTSDKEFENYYKDVSLRMKNKELDILIVVNMFLTGFDATTLNTLWVDKNLKLHGLIQAYSRTNRILNSIKTYGNIVCFRDLSQQTDDAIALFGNKEAGGLVLLRSFEEYMKGFTDNKGKYHKGYEELVSILKDDFPNAGTAIVGEQEEKRFIELYNAILRQRNILTSFDQFAEVDPLTERELQDYASTYQTLHEKYRPNHDPNKTNVNDDIVFEMELIKQIEINIDYILFLIEKFKESGNQNVEVIADIRRAVNASANLRNKRELIENFLASLNPSADSVTAEWLAFIEQQKKEQLEAIITEERLNPDKTLDFIKLCFREGEVKETGTEITDILPPMSMFSKDNKRKETKNRVVEKLKAFFARFYDLGERDA